MKLYHKAAAALSTVALLGGLAACGGADRPSKDELADAMTSEDSAIGGAVPEDMADCMAGLLVDSDISDEALQALVDQDEDYEASKDDEKALKDFQTSAIEECAPDMPETPEAE